jgi:two-component system cell cycle response regulator DivK
LNIQAICVVKILLVEDNEMDRDMLSWRLKRKDCEVVLTVDSQEESQYGDFRIAGVILLDKI